MLLPAHGQFATEIPKNERKEYLYTDPKQFALVKPIVDLKNDYLLLPGDGAQGTVQFAVFRYKGRAPNATAPLIVSGAVVRATGFYCVGG